MIAACSPVRKSEDASRARPHVTSRQQPFELQPLQREIGSASHITDHPFIRTSNRYLITQRDRNYPSVNPFQSRLDFPVAVYNPIITTGQSVLSRELSATDDEPF